MTARGRQLPVLSPEPALPTEAGAPPLELDRRELVKLLAAGASLAGLGALAGCMEPPSERIQPRVEQPPELVPGVPLQYATAMELDGLATGLAGRGAGSARRAIRCPGSTPSSRARPRPARSPITGCPLGRARSDSIWIFLWPLFYLTTR